MSSIYHIYHAKSTNLRPSNFPSRLTYVRRVEAHHHKMKASCLILKWY